MQHEVERAVGFLGQVEDPGDVFVVLNVARRDQLGADRFGQLANPALHLVARQVGETHFGALGQELLSDGPGDAEIIRNAKDHPLLTREDPHT